MFLKNMDLGGRPAPCGRAVGRHDRPPLGHELGSGAVPVPCTRVRTHTPVRAATPTSGQLGGVGLWDLGIPQRRPLCWPHALASGGGRDSRCEGEGCSAWVTRVGRVVRLTAAPQSSLWGELPWAQWESTPVDSSVTLTCSDVQARGPAQDGGGGRGLPAGGALPESIAVSSEAQVCVPAQPPRHLLLSLSRPRSRSVQTQIRFLSIPPAGLARPSPSALLLGAGRGASGSPPPRRPGSDRTLPLAPESRLARRPLHPPPGSLQTAP